MRFCVFMPTHDELVKIFRVHMENANKRAGGKLLEKFDYCKAAENFLDEITRYAEDKNKNMFYTGANVENLVKQANRILKKEKGPYSEEKYKQALLDAAKGKYSQPYGVTNMRDMVVFWLSAFENQYTNAGKEEPFPFSAYDKEKCKFREGALPKADNSYDRYMVERISEEIEKVHKEKE